MSKKLIVVADDFGFSEAYNYGVIKAYKEGVVCTLSLMSNMALKISMRHLKRRL